MHKMLDFVHDFKPFTHFSVKWIRKSLPSYVSINIADILSSFSFKWSESDFGVYFVVSIAIRKANSASYVFTYFPFH